MKKLFFSLVFLVPTSLFAQGEPNVWDGTANTDWYDESVLSGIYIEKCGSQIKKIVVK